MRIKVVLHFLGLLIAILGLAMLLPLGWSLSCGGSDTLSFIISSTISIGCGLLTWRLTPVSEGKLRRREAIMIVAGGWILVSAFGALPYVLAGTFPNYIDAYFEAMSGFTTTGATVLTDIESQPYGILLWRSFTQWLGGMGIITLFVALFPMFGIGAAHMVEFEMPGPEVEKLTVRIRDTAKALWVLYTSFSILELISLWLLGMPIFDALTVTFSTMPTGGFTPTTASIAAYNNPWIELTVIIFMVIAGVNFALFYFLLWKRQVRHLFNNAEFRLYITLIVAAIIFIAINLITSMGLSIGEAFRQSSFQTVSIMTTTGFVTTNFDLWPEFAKVTLLVLMIIGASAGSTGGAIKVIRILVLFKYAYHRVLLSFNPRAVIPLKIGTNVLPDRVVFGIIGMSILYFAVLIIGFLIMSAIMGSTPEMDQATALSSVAATLGNVGPGLGLVGPTANYFWIPAIGKVVLIVCMLVGRLELFAVLAIMVPSFWKWR